MVEFTSALRAELHRMQEESAGSASAIRLDRHLDGSLNLKVDEKRDDDVCVVVDQSRGLTVVIPRDLAEQLEDAIVHFHDTSDDRYDGKGLALLRRRPGTPRAEWTPPTAARRALTPIWTGLLRRVGPANPPGSTTQSAGLGME